MMRLPQSCLHPALSLSSLPLSLQSGRRCWTCTRLLPWTRLTPFPLYLISSPHTPLQLSSLTMLLLAFRPMFRCLTTDIPRMPSASPSPLASGLPSAQVRMKPLTSFGLARSLLSTTPILWYTGGNARGMGGMIMGRPPLFPTTLSLLVASLLIPKLGLIVTLCNKYMLGSSSFLSCQRQHFIFMYIPLYFFTPIAVQTHGTLVKRSHCPLFVNTWLEGLYQCIDIFLPVHCLALGLPVVPSLKPVVVLEELLPLVLVHHGVVVHVVAAPRQNGNIIF